MLEVKNAVCGYRRGGREKRILEDLSLQVKRGEILCILGKNGIGKTTLFRSILGGIPLLGGSVRIDGEDIADMNARERAGKIAYVPQSHTPPFAFSVLQIAVMGRTSRLGVFSTPSSGDYRAAEEALDMVGMLPMKDLPYTEISGGERQLVLIARAIAQGSDYMVMDEPTSNLDFGNRIRVLEQVRKLAGENRGVIMTTHDPDHAFFIADRVAVIRGPGDTVTGRTEDVLTAELMDEIYGIKTGITEVSVSGGRTLRTVVGTMA